MIISKDTQKTFDKIQQQYTIKTLQKLGIEGKYLNIIKTIYEKSTVSFILNGENLKCFPVRSGTKQGCPFFPLLFSTVLEGLAPAIRQKKKGKDFYVGKKKQSCQYLQMHDTAYRKPTDSTKTLSELIKIQ